jgi:hypothetical protein
VIGNRLSLNDHKPLPALLPKTLVSTDTGAQKSFQSLYFVKTENTHEDAQVRKIKLRNSTQILNADIVPKLLGRSKTTMVKKKQPTRQDYFSNVQTLRKESIVQSTSQEASQLYQTGFVHKGKLPTTNK